ncbi:MAG: Wzz/FepE/Etk N-terminal domain-containing protein [Desulfobacteraceae bacterium]|nr:Wzz/FepE/Etk N-terminal domain-containing protein [Desulfobacteraceae bacterium]
MNQQQSNQQQYPRNYPPYEDEINLIDYLKVLWKWKWLIIAGALVCAVIAAAIGLRMPKIYEISTVIEPGIIGVDNSGNYTYMNSNNISGKINEGAYNNSIKKLLNIDSSKTDFEFKADIGKFTNQIKISAESKEKDINLGLKAFKQMVAIISDDGEKVIEQKKDDYDKQILAKQSEIDKIEIQRKDIDKQILMKQNEISKIGTQKKDIDKQIKLKLSEIEKIRNDIKLQQANLKNVGQRKEELLEEINGVKENTKKIIQQRIYLSSLRNMLLKDKNPGYATTIQQNVAYFNQLNTQLYDLKTSEKKIEGEVDSLSRNIDDIKTGIERLNLSKAEGLQAKIYDIKTEIEKIKLQKIEGLQIKINDINAQINSLISEKGNISNIKVIQNPEVSSAPVKSKKKQIVLLSVVVGLFFMIFLAFFIEYIKNASKASSANKIA